MLGLIVLVPANSIFALPALVWASICIAYGILLGVRLHDVCASAAGVAAMAMQAGWSFGFFRGLFNGLIDPCGPAACSRPHWSPFRPP